MLSEGVNILECTLRDGSYAVDFQFTPQDTALIAWALEGAGLRMIEIGHGLGLNASAAGRGEAAALDEEYMAAANGALTTARWGMFFIPGVGRMEDLKKASEYNMHFVRVGSNVTEVEHAAPFIEKARTLGLFVCMNLMKSYVIPPDDLARRAALAESYGADVVYVVDSAGCMLPEEVGRAITLLRDTLTVPIGFHGHDNLHLGVANAVAAVSAGARLVDTTLQGLGRGGGNAATEMFVAVMQRSGKSKEVNLNLLMDTSERLVRPLLGGSGIDSIHVTSGIAGFHSGYLQMVMAQAKKHRVDPRDLILEVCRREQVNPTEELVIAAARHLREKRNTRANAPLSTLHINEPKVITGGPICEDLARLGRALKARSRKHNLPGVMNIYAPMQRQVHPRISPFVQEGCGFVIGSLETDDRGLAASAVRLMDGVVDIFLVDNEQKCHLEQPLYPAAAEVTEISKVLPYKDGEVWVRSVAQQIAAQGRLGEGAAVILGADSLARKLALALAEQGMSILLTGSAFEEMEEAACSIRALALPPVRLQVLADEVEACRGARFLICFARDAARISPAHLEVMAEGGCVLDAGIGSLSPACLEAGSARGLTLLRPDMRAALAAEVQSLLNTHRIALETRSRHEVSGVPVVAGGRIGRRGDVVVDSVTAPEQVVGVADGRGFLLPPGNEEFSDRVASVRATILSQKLGVG